MPEKKLTDEEVHEAIAEVTKTMKDLQTWAKESVFDPLSTCVMGAMWLKLTKEQRQMVKSAFKKEPADGGQNKQSPVV